nr:hypothetical protein [Mycobacterium tilburgii]
MQQDFAETLPDWMSGVEVDKEGGNSLTGPIEWLAKLVPELPDVEGFRSELAKNPAPPQDRARGGSTNPQFCATRPPPRSGAASPGTASGLHAGTASG